MKRSNFRKYVTHVKEQKQVSIEDYYIEKDYFLSLFLSTWQKFKEEKKTPNLDILIFKGGTLLGRNILQYYRISEDLDFTYGGSNDLRVIKNKGKRETEIRKCVMPIIDEIKLICDAVKFDFETDRTNVRYIAVRNSRAVYIFNMYYVSLITGKKIPIKFEINFLEHMMYNCPEMTINNIVDCDLYLKSIGYDLVNSVMKTYSL